MSAPAAVKSILAGFAAGGCAGMADLTEWLSKETGIPVIDGVSVATRMIEALVGSGLKTSKINAYAFPNAK